MRQCTLCAGLCGVSRLHEAVRSVCWAVWCEQAARGSSLCVLCGVSRLHEAVHCVRWAVWCGQAA